MNAICLVSDTWSGSFKLQGLTLPASLRSIIRTAAFSDELAGAMEHGGLDAQADWADIRASLEGDGQAFGRLVQRYQKPISSYLWRFTRQRQVWEELIQDVFVEAFLSLRTYRADAPLLHWLKRIATRIGYRHWRKRQARHCEVPIHEAAAVTDAGQEDAVSRCEAGELVYSLLSRLSSRDRLVMTLMYLEECGTREIAQLTGWSESLVKVQAHRARKRLKKICDREGIEQ